MSNEVKRLTKERDEARAALVVRTKERDAAVEAVERLDRLNYKLNRMRRGWDHQATKPMACRACSEAIDAIDATPPVHSRLEEGGQR